MAKTLEQLLSLSTIIANETKAGANTALRVGGLFSDIIYYLRDLDYADKEDIPSLEGYATEQWVLGKGYATTSDLDDRINALVNGAPQAYDTLKEIADVLAGNVNSIDDILTALGNKADKATTLSGYGIKDAYTISQIDSIVNGLSGNISTLQGYFTEGVANSALRLSDNGSYTAWGQTFFANGKPKSVSGALTGVTTITTSGAATIGGTLSNQVSHLIYDSEKANRLSIAWVNGLSCIYSINADGSRYNDLRLGVTGNTSSQLYLDVSEGKWGIGTSTPEYKLDVNGEARVTKLVIGNGSIEWDETNKGFKVTGLYSTTYLSAKGANTNDGSSSGGGLIESLWKVGDLGKTFNKDANDTFNAYAINAIHNRVSVLEGKATNVSFTQSLTSGTQIGTITIDGASKNIYAPTIPTSDINKGVTAYGWGNHASAGYAMASALSGYQTKITSSNKLDYSLISGVPTKLSQFTNDLGLGTFAYKSSLAFADLTGKPTTLSGYGITDAYTKSQVDSALGGYLPLSGGTINGNLTVGNSTGVLGIKHTSSNSLAYLIYQGDTNWRITDNGWGTSYGIIHSGNIGNQSVASAAKLTTARSIWGQSFDGTGNVSGAAMGLGGAIDFQFSDEINRYGGTLYLQNRGDGSQSGTGGSATGNVVMCKNGGNVLIGTSTDNGYKLDVNGVMNTIALKTTGICIECGTDGATDGHGSEINRFNGNLYLQNRGGNVNICSPNGTTIIRGAAECYSTLNVTSTSILMGNVGIGAAADNNKLCVHGVIRSTAYSAIGNNNAAFVFDKPSSYYTGIGANGVADTIYFGACNTLGAWVTDYYQKWHFNGEVYTKTGIWSDGYVSAKGQNTSSDMRLKNVLNEVVLGVSDIANAPSVRFSWKNGGGIDVGSSAQYWQGLLPDAVKEQKSWLEMQYGNIALVSAISIAKNMVTMEEDMGTMKQELDNLKKENKELKNRIDILERGIA